MMRCFTFVFEFTLLCGAVAWADGVPEPPSFPRQFVLQRTVGKLLLGVTNDHHLLVYRLSEAGAWTEVSRRQLPGAVADLKIIESQVFAVLVRTEVAGFALSDGGQLSDLSAGPTPSAAAESAGKPAAAAHGAATRRLLGTVAKVERGTVLLDLDEAGLVRPGDAVLVRSQRHETKMNMFSGREEDVVSNAATAVLEVRQVEGKRAVAELARGDEASSGDTIEHTDKQPRSVTWFAPRTGYQQWLRATVRPFPNTGSIDFGSLTDLAFGYYWEFLHFQAKVAPYGLSIPHAVKAYNVHALLSYQNDVAEFGVGGGYFSHSFEGRYEYECTSSGYFAAASSDGSTPAPKINCKQSGPTFAQHLRLGSVDGLNLRITNSLAVDRGQFRFGYLDGAVDVPVSRSLNLYASGGGSTGLKWGEAGMRTFLRGVGGRDTLILTTGIGGTSMRTAEMFGGTEVKTDVGGVTVNDTQDRESSIGGLHIAVGLEWRR